MAAKVITIGLPEEMLPELDQAARREHCSLPELIQHAIRQYLEEGGRLIPLDDAAPDEAQAVVKGRRQFKRGEFVRLEDLQNELGLPTR
jgi:predicted transcriptional regulator